MAAKMRLTKTAREKLKKEAELYKHTCYFIASFGSTKVLDIAYANVDSVSQDLDVILSSSKTTCYSSSCLVDDVSSIIIKSRSRVEKELIKICEKTNVIETKQAFQEFLVHLKQGDISKYRSKTDASRDALVDALWKRYVEKAPQLTKQKKDEKEKHDVYLEKLYKEYRDYNATVRFMLLFLSTEQVTNVEQRRLLSSALNSIMYLRFDFERHIRSDEVLCDKDLSLFLSEYRSKVMNALQGICDNVSNLIVQEAYTRYLDDFKTGLKISPQDHLSRFRNEDGKITSSKPKMSVKKKKSKLQIGGSRNCKTPSLIDPNMNDLYSHTSFVSRGMCYMNKDLKASEFDEEEEIKWTLARVKQDPRIALEHFASPPTSDDDSE